MWQFFLKEIEFYLVPLCFVCAWGLTLIAIWSIIGILTDMARKTQQMHQIPCANCVFFSGDYRLKCPVNPKIALSEEAIDCPDYQRRGN